MNNLKVIITLVNNFNINAFLSPGIFHILG